jgi:hypothetical protein
MNYTTQSQVRLSLQNSAAHGKILILFLPRIYFIHRLNPGMHHQYGRPGVICFIQLPVDFFQKGVAVSFAAAQAVGVVAGEELAAAVGQGLQNGKIDAN